MEPAELTIALRAYRQAVAIAGGQLALEKLTGIKQQTTSYRLNNDVPLQSVEEVLLVEAATGVSGRLLRPDIYPLPLPHEGEDPGEDCGPILAKRDPAVAFDRRTETKLTGTGQ